MDIRLDTVTRARTAVVVVEPIDFSVFMQCFDQVYDFLAKHTDVRQVGQNIALYDRGGRMEVGVVVDRPFDPSGSVVASVLPEGRIARATHTTGYDDLRLTYDAIGAWCDANGHERAGVQWEVYGDPDEPSGHVDVDVCFLLR